MRLLTAEDVTAACFGGGVFACGGGGWLRHGLSNGEIAVKLGRPMLASLDEIPDDGIIVTVTAIGAPASPDWQMYPRDYIRALELLGRELGKPVAGLMTAQNGYSTTINGWLQSAMTGIPVVDVAGDVRAHPTGNMGSMGLTSLKGYETIQVVVGGNRELGAYLEVVSRGDVTRTSKILREASIQSGGFIASARNPIAAAYVKNHGAVGAISCAIGLGQAMVDVQSRGAAAVIDAIVNTTGGELLGVGKVKKFKRATRASYDFAHYRVDCGKTNQQGRELTVHTLNEHMAVENEEGERLSTYPDTICLLSLADGMPVSVEFSKKGMEVAVLKVDRYQLPLSSGVLDPAIYPEVEAWMGIELAKYL